MLSPTASNIRVEVHFRLNGIVFVNHTIEHVVFCGALVVSRTRRENKAIGKVVRVHQHTQNKRRDGHYRSTLESGNTRNAHQGVAQEVWLHVWGDIEVLPQ